MLWKMKCPIALQRLIFFIQKAGTARNHDKFNHVDGKKKQKHSMAVMKQKPNASQAVDYGRWWLAANDWTEAGDPYERVRERIEDAGNRSPISDLEHQLSRTARSSQKLSHKPKSIHRLVCGLQNICDRRLLCHWGKDNNWDKDWSHWERILIL